MNLNLWLVNTKKTCESLIFIVAPLEKEIRFYKKGKREKIFKVRHKQLHSNNILTLKHQIYLNCYKTLFSSVHENNII